MRAAALVAFAFDRGDAAVLAHADLEPDVGLRPAAMGDEGFLAVGDDAHFAARLARQQRGDDLEIQRLGAAAEAAADMRLDHADARHLHAEDLRQHQVHVVGHLRRGMHGHAVAQRVVFGDRRVQLHLLLADLGAVIGALAHQIGLARSPARCRRVRTARRARYCRACCRAAARRRAPARPWRCNRPAIRAL